MARSAIVLMLLLAGCTGVTPIRDLGLPPVTTIQGSVTKLAADGFALSDSSGSIFVKARLPEDRKLDLSLNETVKVYGNLRAGEEKVFDAYVIRKPTGEQIIITNPTPHFGFIIQSSFQ